MANPKTINVPSNETQGERKLICCLRLTEKMGVRGPLKGLGELELENISNETIIIHYQMSPLQFLDLRIVGPENQVIATRCFGDQFSPMADKHELRLEPGEKFCSEIPLLGTIPPDQRNPGFYKIQAIYRYYGFQAESNSVLIEVQNT